MASGESERHSLSTMTTIPDTALHAQLQRLVFSISKDVVKNICRLDPGELQLGKALILDFIGVIPGDDTAMNMSVISAHVHRKSQTLNRHFAVFVVLIARHVGIVGGVLLPALRISC